MMRSKNPIADFKVFDPFPNFSHFAGNLVTQNQRRLLDPVPFHKIAAADAARPYANQQLTRVDLRNRQLFEPHVPIYIPFQLTTKEFFQESYDHLNDDGVMVLNAGRYGTDYRLRELEKAGVYHVEPSTGGGKLAFNFVVQTGRGDSVLTPTDPAALKKWWEPATVTQTSRLEKPMMRVSGPPASSLR